MTKRSRRIPAAFLFLIGLRAAVTPQTEDEMSIAEIIEDDGERESLPIRVRLASLRDYEEMCSLFDELDALHRQARPEMFQPSRRPRARASRWRSGWLSRTRPCW